MLAHFLQLRGPEWIFTLIVGGLAMLSGQIVAPYCREFFWNDASISRPYIEDNAQIIPDWALVPLTVVPVFVMWVLIRFHRIPGGGTLRDECNAWALVQAETVMLQLAFVQFCKAYAGRLRPDFLSRMTLLGYEPTDGIASHCELIHKEPLIWKGHQSFPSGHSSTIFGSMVPFAFFLMNRLQPLQRRSIICLAVSALPLFLACQVAVSRTRDNRHHFSDILAGSLIGAGAAVASIRLNLERSSTKKWWAPKEAPDLDNQLATAETINSEA